MAVDIGIDLGTASILVYVKGKGVILKEPSVVAFDRDSNEVKAIGEEARLMLGRTPGNIIAVRPLRQGVISDYTVTEKMIKYFVQKALGRRTFQKPRISICVPSGVTEVERNAVQQATFAAGARDVYLIEEPSESDDTHGSLPRQDPCAMTIQVSDLTLPMLPEMQSRNSPGIYPSSDSPVRCTPQSSCLI